MKAFPVILDLEDKKVLVVGGGAVALQKVQDLLKAGASPQMVAQNMSPELLKLARQKKVKYSERAFRDSDIKEIDLVFSATDDEKFNRRLSRLCRARHLWVNAVDQQEHCTFIMPAVFRRGSILAAISTGGSSPALAKYLRKRLEQNLGPEVEALARVLKGVRNKLLNLNLSERRKVLESIISEKSLSLIRRGAESRVRKNIERIIKKK